MGLPLDDFPAGKFQGPTEPREHTLVDAKPPPWFHGLLNLLSHSVREIADLLELIEPFDRVKLTTFPTPLRILLFVLR